MAGETAWPPEVTALVSTIVEFVVLLAIAATGA